MINGFPDEVVGKMIVDEDYRDKVFTDPENTLKAANVDPAAIAAFMSVPTQEMAEAINNFVGTEAAKTC